MVVGFSFILDKYFSCNWVEIKRWCFWAYLRALFESKSSCRASDAWSKCWSCRDCRADQVQPQAADPQLFEIAIVTDSSWQVLNNSSYWFPSGDHALALIQQKQGCVFTPCLGWMCFLWDQALPKCGIKGCESRALISENQRDRELLHRSCRQQALGVNLPIWRGCDAQPGHQEPAPQIPVYPKHRHHTSSSTLAARHLE